MSAQRSTGRVPSRRAFLAPGIKRARIACVTLAAFICILVALGVQSCYEQTQKAPGPLAYLMLKGAGEKEDPLQIAGAQAGEDRGLELLGVSQDRRTIGYSSAASLAETAMLIDQGLRAQGWLPVDSSKGSAMSFIRSEPDELASASSLLVFCTERPDGTSVVVELLR
ncbi:MAG: hypothetical protein LBU48_01390 [Coriobacteriales bacterium]|jgi:hypothetical protein|nr:hypothetical protein [Coriobacteriales bacterium]